MKHPPIYDDCINYKQSKYGWFVIALLLHTITIMVAKETGRLRAIPSEFTGMPWISPIEKNGWKTDD